MADLFFTTTLKIYRRIRRKINRKSHAREFLSLIANVPVDISQIVGFCFWKSADQFFQNLPDVALHATSIPWPKILRQ